MKKKVIYLKPGFVNGNLVAVDLDGKTWNVVRQHMLELAEVNDQCIAYNTETFGCKLPATVI